ncbi:MAG: DUF5690 family protein [Planctomycetota bacterium]
MGDSPRQSRKAVDTHALFVAAAAAFCTYFCMYAFRKPFTAATYENQEIYGLAAKTVLVTSQLFGYMLSKFIGIKVVSEMTRVRAGLVLVGLISVAELALVAFAFAPTSLRPICLFANGLPLGMVFGLVLVFLEGRKQTEALSAALCASFIVSSGAVKSIGEYLLQDWQVNEYQMPMIVGGMFFVPLLISVWVLQSTPAPSSEDLKERNERKPLSRSQRWAFFRKHWPGLSLMIFVYIALTIIRTVRDDFGVEIWRDLGVSKKPEVFVRSETVVAVFVVAFNAAAIWIRNHLTALKVVAATMCLAFAVSGLVACLQSADLVSPFVFMVACGVGLYIPYVAFHTTVFERLVAASSQAGNLVFLMYLADAIGYLGYAMIMIGKSVFPAPGEMLPFFLGSLIAGSIGCVIALLAALIYFQKTLSTEEI